MRIDDVLSAGLSPLGYQPGWQDSLPFAAPAAGSAFTRTVPGELAERLYAVTYVLTPSAVAATRRPRFNVIDGQGNIVLQRPAGPHLQAAQAVTAFLAPGFAPVFSPAAGYDANGSVNNPGAGGVIASAVVPKGVYTVGWSVSLGGTTGAGDADNFALNVGAAQIVTSINQSSSGSFNNQEDMVIDVPADGTTISITAVAAGTVGSTYRAQFSAVPDSGGTYYGTLADCVLPSGWAWQIALDNMDAGDTITGVRAWVWRYPASQLTPEPGG